MDQLVQVDSPIANRLQALSDSVEAFLKKKKAGGFCQV